MGAGAAGVAALALRPRRSVAETVGASMPAGLWGPADTDAGLLALWSAGNRAAVVRLSENGPIEVVDTLTEPQLAVLAGVAAGGPPLVLGAAAEAIPRTRSIAVDHLEPGIRAALLDESDGPLSLDGVEIDEIGPLRGAARTLRGADVSIDVPLPAGGIVSAVLADRWVCVQHPPNGEGDHCSSLTVFDGGSPVLHVDDLGAAGPAALAGPVDTPVVSVADGEGRVRVWQLGAATDELSPPGVADGIAVHVADGRPIALRTSPDGATLLAHGPVGWEAVADVDGTAGAGRTVAVSGTVAQFLVELGDRVVAVDGQGAVRR